MTISDIGIIVAFITSAQLLVDLLSHRFIFQSDTYIRTVSSFERAKTRRDKTAASLGTKQSMQENEGNKKKNNINKNQIQQPSQKSAEREKKKLQRENEEFSALAAEVARKHTLASVYSSIVFLVLYKVLALKYAGKVVALIPFQPFRLFHRATFYGLGGMEAGAKSLGELQALWQEYIREPMSTIPGSNIPLSHNVPHASQACSFTFIYMLCSLSIKMMVSMAFGTKPPKGADDGMSTFMDSPQSMKIMESLGFDANEVKEVRNTFGLSQKKG